MYAVFILLLGVRHQSHDMQRPQGAALPIASSYYLTFVGVVGSPSVLQESERDRKVLEFLLWLRLLHIGGDPYFASL
jgi:hypothetical protein